MVGGEAADSSIVLARLGASVKLDGNRIGADEAGRRTKAILDGFRIDTSRLRPGRATQACRRPCSLRGHSDDLRHLRPAAGGTGLEHARRGRRQAGEGRPRIGEVVSESYLKSQFAGRAVEAVFDDYLRAMRGAGGDRVHADPGSAELASLR